MWPFKLCCLTGGEWEEPWDQQSALDTICKLERRWYQLDRNNAAPDQSGEAEEQPEAGSSDDEGPPRKQSKLSVNKVCPHVACSAQPVCLVEQLQTVRSNYRGRVDQFRIKVEHCCLAAIRVCASVNIHDGCHITGPMQPCVPATCANLSELYPMFAHPACMSWRWRQVVCAQFLARTLLLLQAVERAIRELTCLRKPLVSESEVAALTMGARSKEKVLEIIQTGTLRRNEMMADDEEQQVMQLVLRNLLCAMTRAGKRHAFLSCVLAL